MSGGLGFLCGISYIYFHQRKTIFPPFFYHRRDTSFPKFQSIWKNQIDDQDTGRNVRSISTPT